MSQKASTSLNRRPLPRRRLASLGWAVVVLLTLAIPVVLLERTGVLSGLPLLHVLSLATGLIALSLLVAAFLLPSRVRTLTSQLGIERVLRTHRALAVAAGAIVLAHVVFAVAHSPAGLGLLDLRTAPPRVWFALTATVSIVAIVVLAWTRRRRRPRYEGWRLSHVILANVIVIATAMHVWLLDDLVNNAMVLAWFTLLAVLVVGLWVYRWWWRPRRQRQNAYLIDEIHQHPDSSATLVLHAEGHEGVPFRPGQFAFLKIGASPHVFEEHPFTIASAATEPWRKEFTIKALGDFSELVAGMKAGRRVYLDGPHGSFTVDGLASEAIVLIAGGVGITPMLSMVRTLAERRDQRHIVLFVAGRTADDLLHRERLDGLVHDLDLDIVEILEEPPESWDGEVGWLTRPMLKRHLPRLRQRIDYFICGPGPMVAAVTRTLEGLGVRNSRIHTELFDVV
ncbi:ferredoxin reductase family protein [Terrabacter terrigena]|uniref:Ferric reductase-like transmembrane domain-containing protein n=1 Tax=Terrabacter terrigena TaxID=574718 RepID=A0ABW3MVE6_9MICO